MSLRPHPQLLHRFKTISGEIYYVLGDSLIEATIQVEEFLHENPSQEGGCAGDLIYSAKVLKGSLLLEVMDGDDENEVVPAVEDESKARATDATRTKN